MKALFQALSLLAISSCASHPVAPPLPPIIVQGCTIDLEIPMCPTSNVRPYFDTGETGSDLAVEYENIKADLLRSEGCVQVMQEAITNWRKACAVEGH